MRALTQPVRLLVLTVYLFILFLASRLALGSWLPPTTAKGLWFYSGLASLLLGNLLVTPFFTKPSDAIAYGVAALIALLSVKPVSFRSLDGALWVLTSVYICLPVAAGTLSIALKNVRQPALERLSRSLFVIADSLGSPTSVFSVAFLFALVSFHRETAAEYLVIGVAWAVLVALRPLELILGLAFRVSAIWTGNQMGEQLGQLIGRQVPRILLIRHEPAIRVRLGDLLVVPGDDGQPCTALALDHVGFAEGRWLRAIELFTPDNVAKTLADSMPSDADTCRVLADGQVGPQLTDQIYTNRSRLIGLVAPETDLTRLLFEVVRTDLNLGEGQLLSVVIGQTEVLYQIISGLTKEEIIQQKNTRGYVRGAARKIGHWNQTTQRFDPVKWLPAPNAPVFLMQAVAPIPNAQAVGYFPLTNYPLFVDVNQLVTHNAAVLGVLGAGKSFLALELVERMITSGLKVVCLDLTNQYANELVPYYNSAAETVDIDALRAVGPPGKTSARQNVEEGGSIQQFRQRLNQLLTAFLAPENPARLKLYNPLQFEVWRQDSRMFNNTASMAMLTPTELTRVFAEVMLEVVQAQGMTDQARCCLVLEEAHSLIPEWSAAASDGDRSAANGTARAILQGRKFGLGCLVITQRTANVTKSILNQCNTIFALRVYDATGMEFLKAYIGDDYANVLSALEDRHAVAFGRGSSCRDPILIRLNDRQRFLEVFRPHAPVAEAAPP